MIDHDLEDALLARFRAWIAETRADLDASDVAIEPTSEDTAPAIGLYRLAEEFTALRHEVKLQTKGARGLGEQAEALLAGLRQAIEQFRAVEPKEAQAAFAASKPLAEALADLDEALDRGRSEIAKARARLAGGPAGEFLGDLDALDARLGTIERLATRGYRMRLRALLQQRATEPRPELVDALLEGYGLIQDRLRRSLFAAEIQRIDCQGRPVDPELMTVVELIDVPGLEPGTVADEVRRGYTWRGRVLRFAEVRATPANEERGMRIEND